MDIERESLSERQAWMLLRSASVGRVVYTSEALPAVLPVRFRVSPDAAIELVIQQPELAQALDRSVVAFETGELNVSDGCGWTVTVVGRATVLGDPSGGSTVPWTPTVPGQLLIRIAPGLVLGRDLGAASPGQAASADHC